MDDCSLELVVTLPPSGNVYCIVADAEINILLRFQVWFKLTTWLFIPRLLFWKVWDILLFIIDMNIHVHMYMYQNC